MSPRPWPTDIPAPSRAPRGDRDARPALDFETYSKLFEAMALLNAILTGAPPMETDPDAYVREHGIDALCRLIHIPPPSPYDRAAARFDRAWDAIERVYSRHPGTALWHEEGIEAVRREEQRRAEAARRAAVEEELRARLASGGRSGDVLDRAARYLAKLDTGPGALWTAALATVRGFGLDGDVAMGLLEREYVPRYHRKVPRQELLGVVKRAARADRTPWGWLLTRGRR
jgi:hypothetical protein